MKANNPVTHLRWRVGIPACALVVFLGFVLGDFFFFYKPGPNGAERTVIIPKGESLAGVTRILDGEGLVAFAPSFYWTARLSGAATDIRAGEYLVPAGASQAEILQILRQGRVVLHKITVPEGLSVLQILALLTDDERLSGDISTIPAEGTLLPETYLYARGEDRDDLLRRMAEKHYDLLEGLWDSYDYSLPFKTPEEAVILASLVEEETAVPEERALIAAVYINRLRHGMRLQSDPTVIYGLTGGRPLGHPIRQSELKKNTPYNTYLHEGLPPGPISNPGEASLRAVFNPAPSDALFFVADGSGGHVFAATLEEHNENVRKWRKFEKDGAANP